jgi:hypothetical protein
MNARRRTVIGAMLLGAVIGSGAVALVLTRLAPAKPGPVARRAVHLPALRDPRITTFQAPRVERQPYLDRRIAEARGTFTLERLAEVVRDAARLNVVVEWRQLETAGIEKTATARLDVRDVTVHQFLAAALATLSHDGSLAYVAEDDLIRITTRDHVDRGPVVRVYDVAGLIGSAETFDAAYRRAFPEASGRIRTMTDGPAETLSAAILQLIDTDSWVDNGGRFGTLRYFGGMLIVGQTPENQRRVAEFLAALGKGK